MTWDTVGGWDIQNCSVVVIGCHVLMQLFSALERMTEGNLKLPCSPSIPFWNNLLTFTARYLSSPNTDQSTKLFLKLLVIVVTQKRE